MKTAKKQYEAPQLTAVTFKMEHGFATSSLSMSGLFRLDNAWSNESGDAWDGSPFGSSGNRFGGGWTDNGSSAWE